MISAMNLVSVSTLGAENIQLTGDQAVQLFNTLSRESVAMGNNGSVRIMRQGNGIFCVHAIDRVEFRAYTTISSTYRCQVQAELAAAQ